jgi:glycosyltransferase involved in cell wall biosynthesis
MSEEEDTGVPRVSVVIATKDRCGLLAEALASVYALAGPDLALEVIVADNGSCDETPAVAAQFGARFV